ncbi:hypothetical protein [Streptacidiphilus cavernicola]|uniref:Uncharacterized protein n=1 Tax=Streptacidiphilus cavernicola TaxID=3342716 RepID=A0ABV6VYL4_9ACTN
MTDTATDATPSPRSVREALAQLLHAAGDSVAELPTQVFERGRPTAITAELLRRTTAAVDGLAGELSGTSLSWEASSGTRALGLVARQQIVKAAGLIHHEKGPACQPTRPLPADTDADGDQP